MAAKIFEKLTEIFRHAITTDAKLFEKFFGEKNGKNARKFRIHKIINLLI